MPSGMGFPVSASQALNSSTPRCSSSVRVTPLYILLTYLPSDNLSKVSASVGSYALIFSSIYSVLCFSAASLTSSFALPSSNLLTSNLVVPPLPLASPTAAGLTVDLSATLSAFSAAFLAAFSADFFAIFFALSLAAFFIAVVKVVVLVEFLLALLSPLSEISSNGSLKVSMRIGYLAG